MSNRETLDSMIKAFDAGDFEGLKAALREDYIDHSAPPGLPSGPDGAVAMAKMVKEGFTDGSTVVDEVIESGDRLAVRWTFTGKQTGEFMDMAPSGKTVSLQGMEFHRYADGKLAESWAIVDMMALMPPVPANPS